MSIAVNHRFLARYGQTLIQRGYNIVPIKPRQKCPDLAGWQDIKADAELCKRWLANGHADSGVGLLTKHTPCIDIDCYDETVIDNLIAFIEDTIGETLQRVGREPKTLLVFKTDAPFTKVTSRCYYDEFGLANRVEVLGDGQQAVMYGIHPDTDKPYFWDGAHLAETACDDLPTLTQEQAQAVVDYFESIVPSEWSQTNPSVSKAPTSEFEDQALRAINNAKPTLTIDFDRLKKQVMLLSADEYSQWVTVGMALYHQFDGSAEGLALWDEWSATSDKYSGEGMTAKWQSFEANLSRQNPITARTILKLAKDAQTPATLDSFLARYVFVEKGNLVYDLKKPARHAMSELREFNNRTANERHEVPAPTQKDPDKTKLEAINKAWLVHPERKSAEGLVYEPGLPRLVEQDGLQWVNSFYAPLWAETKETYLLKPFFEHLNYLVPDKNEREWLIGWLAFCLQKPDTRCKVTPLHVSIPHGTGRGWIVALISELLGYWNVSKTKMDVLCGVGSAGQFNDYLNGSLVCAIEEVREGSKRFEVSDKIRDTLEAEYLEVNNKYGGKNTQRVFTNFFLASNHPDALVLTKEDRRITVLSGPDHVKSREYYTHIYNWLRDKNTLAQCYHWLMRYDLSNFEWQYAPDTSGKEKMIENNRTDTERWFWEMMQEPPCEVMSLSEIEAHITKIAVDEEASAFEVESKQIQKLLQHFAKSARLKIKGKVVRLWVLSGREMSNQEIKEVRDAKR